MKRRLTISVVIVTLNRAHLLRDALASLMRQTRPPDEVVVVDNGSTDTTGEVIAEFASSLNLISVEEPRRGIPYARNTGVRHASKDIVAFIDDDCVASPDWLHFVEMPFVQDPDVGVVGGEVSYLKGSGNVLDQFHARCMPHQD